MSENRIGDFLTHTVYWRRVIRWGRGCGCGSGFERVWVTEVHQHCPETESRCEGLAEDDGLGQ